MNMYVNNNLVSQRCWRVFPSPVWKRHNATSDHPPLRLLTPLQVRPPFLVLMGIISHMVHISLSIWFYWISYDIITFCGFRLNSNDPNWKLGNCPINLKYCFFIFVSGFTSLLLNWCSILPTNLRHLLYSHVVLFFPEWCHPCHPVDVWQTNVQVLTSLLSPPAPALVSAGSLTSRWMMAQSYLRLRGKRYERTNEAMSNFIPPGMELNMAVLGNGCDATNVQECVSEPSWKWL